MNTELDPQLRSAFASYAPALPAEPFRAQTVLALRHAQRRAQITTLLGWTGLALLAIAVAPFCSELIEKISASVNATHAAIDGVLMPWQTQLASYLLAAVLLLINYRRIRALFD